MIIKYTGQIVQEHILQLGEIEQIFDGPTITRFTDLIQFQKGDKVSITVERVDVIESAPPALGVSVDEKINTGDKVG